MWSKRKHGLFTEPVPVSAYVGSSKNLKDLKDRTVQVDHFLFPASRLFQHSTRSSEPLCLFNLATGAARE
jgi:hypothetical protein